MEGRPDVARCVALRSASKRANDAAHLFLNVCRRIDRVADFFQQQFPVSLSESVKQRLECREGQPQLLSGVLQPWGILLSRVEKGTQYLEPMVASFSPGCNRRHVGREFQSYSREFT